MTQRQGSSALEVANHEVGLCTPEARYAERHLPVTTQLVLNRMKQFFGRKGLAEGPLRAEESRAIRSCSVL